MLYGSLFSDSIDGSELFVRNGGGIGPELIQFGNVPFYEYLQLTDVDEAVRVGNDGIQEFAVLFIAFHLPPSVLCPRDDHRFQPDAVLHHEHVRIEPELPSAVLQFSRDYNLEFQVHFPMTFSYIPEPCRNHCGPYDIGGGHLSVFIFHCIHYQHVFRFAYLNGIFLLLSVLQ